MLTFRSDHQTQVITTATKEEESFCVFVPWTLCVCVSVHEMNQPYHQIDDTGEMCKSHMFIVVLRTKTFCDVINFKQQSHGSNLHDKNCGRCCIGSDSWLTPLFVPFVAKKQKVSGWDIYSWHSEITTEWVAMKFCADFFGAQRMKPTKHVLSFNTSLALRQQFDGLQWNLVLSCSP